jgi:hypothetical protein
MRQAGISASHPSNDGAAEDSDENAGSANDHGRRRPARAPARQREAKNKSNDAARYHEQIDTGLIRMH